METKYDAIINILQDNWFMAVLLILCGVLMAIPQVREGAMLMWNWGEFFISQKRRNLV